MNVYIVRPNSVGCGGCAIVAAPTRGKALELANKDKYKEQYIDLYVMRLVHLEADYSEPRVIADEIYIEDDAN
jgi:hypothetical protein